MNLASSTVMVLVISTTLAFCQNPAQRKPIKWVETIGEHNPKGYNHGNITYIANGEQYSQPFYIRNPFAAPGEKYTMRYNADNPEETQVDYWHQVFLPGELTYTVDAKIDKIVNKSFFNKRSRVEFSFLLGNETIERYADLPPNYKQLYPNLTVNQHYPVECFVIDTTNGLRLSTGRIVLHLENLNKSK
jgi:hypothetical protein